MLLFSEGPIDGREDFEQRARPHVDHVADLTTADGTPDYPAINDYIKENVLWKKGVKEFYAAVQHRKCGYCERMLTDYGDVEHYRPKSAIFTLRARGKEAHCLNNTRGRKFHKPPHPGSWDSGYWWLAYQWDNYLVSCGICNQAWKNALFPIKDSHQRRPQPGDETEEVAYLLDPFGDVDPAAHLEFTAAGGIRAYDGSRIGEETIETCGLWRPSLVVSRLEKAQKVERKLKQLADALATDADPRPALEDIYELGDERWVHAGMVRIMFIQNTGWTWEKLAGFLSDSA